MMNARMLPIFIKTHLQIIKQGRCVPQTVPFQVKTLTCLPVKNFTYLQQNSDFMNPHTTEITKTCIQI